MLPVSPPPPPANSANLPTFHSYHIPRAPQPLLRPFPFNAFRFPRAPEQAPLCSRARCLARAAGQQVAYHHP